MNPFRKMTVADRMKAGIGAVGPNHPRVRAMAMQALNNMKAKPADEPEEEDNPEEEAQEGAPPNLRESEECGACVHYDGNQCKKFDVPVEEDQVCDDFERSDNVDMDERRQANDEEENADQNGEY